MSTASASMVDVAFAIDGRAVPRDHGRSLAEAVLARLPWLADTVGAGVHPIRVAAGSGAQALLSGRSRLTLRVPRGRVEALRALGGAVLDVGGTRLVVQGAPQLRELLPHGTLYAHGVAAESDDELAFVAAVDAEMAALGVAGRRICGRLRHLDDGAQRRPAFGLMLDGLSPPDALRLLEHGLGAHRLWGCGLFVPHRSAAAVGG